MVVVIFFFLLILTPASPVFRIVAIIIPLIISLMILSMRGTYTATIDEVNIPAEVTGAAVSIASLIGYLPTMFANYMFGSILDSNPGVLGYRIVFGLTMGAAIMGFVVASMLIKKINKNKLASAL